MTNKAYIVANEQQESEILKKLERDGGIWVAGGEKPTEWSPSRGGKEGDFFFQFPYTLEFNGKVSWTSNIQEEDEEIIFDGRKEEHMSEKYVVSQEFMNELEEWKASLKTNGRYYIYEDDIYDLPSAIENWWKNSRGHDKEANNRLITIIRWVNGEDVFEVEKPKKWIVRSKETDEYGDYRYTLLMNFANLVYPNSVNEDEATRFDTKEEAESWANAHQEVIEVEA